MAFPDARRLASATPSACEFDGVQIKSISEVSGLKMEQDVIEYKAEHRRRRQVPHQEAAGTVEGGRMHAHPRR